MNTQEIYEHLASEWRKLSDNLDLAINEGRESDANLIRAKIDVITNLANKINPPKVWVA